jgi:non-ribosomal peptide synthetase component F
LLSVLTRTEEIVVGSPTAGRSVPEVEPLIGYFVNTLVLRGRLSGDPDFREALRRVRGATLGAFANQDVPLERLIEELRPERTLRYNPLFQVWFVLQNASSEREPWRGLSVESVDIETRTTRHDLQLTLWESATGLEGAFTYSTDLFESETITRIAAQFQALLAVVADRPDTRLSRLRATLDDVYRDYRRRTVDQLEQESHRRLRSAKRKSVIGAQ